MKSKYSPLHIFKYTCRILPYLLDVIDLNLEYIFDLLCFALKFTFKYVLNLIICFIKLNQIESAENFTFFR